MYVRTVYRIARPIIVREIKRSKLAQMAYSRSASGFIVCFIVATLVVSNEMNEAEAAFGLNSECQQACQQVEQRSAHGCLVSCMYRCMPLVGTTSGCHPNSAEIEVLGHDATFPAAGSGPSSTPIRKIKS